MRAKKTNKQKIKRSIEISDTALRRLSITNIAITLTIFIAQLIITIFGCVRYAYSSSSEPTGQEIVFAAYNVFLLVFVEILFAIWALIIYIGIKNAKPIKKAGSFVNSLVALLSLWVLTSVSVVLILNHAPKGISVVNTINIVITVLEIACLLLSAFLVNKKSVSDKMIKIIKTAAIGIILINVMAPLMFFAYAFLMILSYSS